MKLEKQTPLTKKLTVQGSESSLPFYSFCKLADD